MRGLNTVVGVHIDESTVIGRTVHPSEDRVTVDLRPPHEQYRSCRVTVFARRAELIRPRDTLTDVISELSAARCAWQTDNERRSPSEAA